MFEIAPFFSLVGLASVIAVICWKLVTCHESIYGADVRARDRERQDYLRVIEQLTEKFSARPHSEDALDIARLHTAERNNAAALNARVEEKAGANGKPTGPHMVSTADPEIGAMHQ
jgi:hypothetical protein